MSKNLKDLKAYKTKRKIASTPKKQPKFIELDACLHSVLGMPGLPQGHITQIFGLSDTGKTSLVFHTAAKAQEQEILPVFIITEGKVDWGRARSMGLKYTGDLPESEQQDDFCLVEEGINTLEGMFDYITNILMDVERGDLPYDIHIFVDSIGNTPSEKEFEVDKKTGKVVKKATMMVAAKVISERMRLISAKVNDSNKISHPNFAGLTFINHAYTEPASFPGGMPKLVPYGGKKIWYVSSLVLKTARRSKLSAAKDGSKVGFGIVSKIVVDKNHITNAAFEGEFVITADAILPNTKSVVDNYKKAHKDSWGEIEVQERFAEESDDEDTI